MAAVRHRCGAARLRSYGGMGPAVVVMPSLINPPAVLDLARERSLMRWLATQGFAAWLVDWGAPRPRDRDLDVGGHVAERLLPLLARLGEPVLLVGYCLGGTMALAAACHPRADVRGVATIAAPWRFAGYGERARIDMAELWQAAAPLCERLGVVPMEVLQTAFWRLDPARTVAKYARFASLPAAEAGFFVTMEDWANAGAPLTLAAGRELFEGMLAEDRPGTGRWVQDGVAADPAALRCPAIEFVSLSDRIVPAATAAGLRERRDLGTGHVGMVVGGRAREQLWEPLAAWLHDAAAATTSAAPAAYPGR